MKYIDLHCHLDGSITPDIAKKLARLQNIDLGVKDDDELAGRLVVPKTCRSLNEFLECFSLPLSLMQTKEGIGEAVYLVCEELRADSVCYAELRFAPQLHMEKGLSMKEVIDAALEGLKRSELYCNLILCCMRGEGNSVLNYKTIDLARTYLDEAEGVVAVDLAGAEGLYPTADYRELFEYAATKGLPFTIHAGEADGAESVRLAVEYGARRIGHGVRIIEDAEVYRLVKEKGIYLECCPTSNRVTAAVADMSRYPIKRFLDDGIRATINTDDMAILGTDIGEEFDYIMNNCGIDKQDVRVLMKNAVEAAFVSEAKKEGLREIIFAE